MSAAAGLSGRVDHWIFQSHPASAESLSFYRILFASYVLVCAMPNASWAGGLPPEVWNPPAGLMRLLRGFPPAPVLQTLSFLLSLALVALLVGYRTRLASFVTSGLLWTLVGFESCFGKIDHNRHLMMLVPLALAFSAWGTRYSVDAVRQTSPTVGRDWPLTWLALCVGLFFWTGGVLKIEAGWLDPGSHAVQFFLARAGTVSPNSLPGPLWEALDYLTVLFEAGFLFTILSLRTTRIACALAVLFHVANVLWMHINFAEQLVVYGAFVAWDRAPFMSRLGRVATSAAVRLDRAPWLLIVAGTLYFAFHETLGSPFSVSLPRRIEVRLVYWSVPATLAVLHLLREAHATLAWLRSRRRSTHSLPQEDS